MSSIASIGVPPQSFSSPLSQLQDELSSEVSAGTISTDDQSALSSALNDIDSELKGDAPTDGSRPGAGDIKSKINDLIAKEVSDGKLSSDQAEELKNVFAQTFKQGPGGPGGPGGPDGSGGSGGADGDAGVTQDTSGSSDISQALSDFLKLVQNSQGSSSSYGSNGDSLLSQIQSLIVNYQA